MVIFKLQSFCKDSLAFKSSCTFSGNRFGFHSLGLGIDMYRCRDWYGWQKDPGSLASVFDDQMSDQAVPRCSISIEILGERSASLSQQSTANRHPKVAGRHILGVPGWVSFWTPWAPESESSQSGLRGFPEAVWYREWWPREWPRIVLKCTISTISTN